MLFVVKTGVIVPVCLWTHNEPFTCQASFIILVLQELPSAVVVDAFQAECHH
jgi:hypothetical protein